MDTPQLSNSKFQFCSYFRTRISPKRNIQLPSAWSRKLEGQWFLRRGSVFELPYIEVVPLEMLQSEQKQAGGKSKDSSIQNHPADFLSENCRPLQLTSRARFTLPREWCDAANIPYPGTIILAGKMECFDIFNRDHHNKLVAIELQ